jgi:NADH:ubiquinone oxidoreductase subunit E
MTVEKILLGFAPDLKNLLPVLKEISASFGWVEKKNAQKVAKYFQISLSQVFETASFYDLIKIKKGATVEIKVCSGANCATRSAYRVLKEIENVLGIQEDDRFNANIRLEVMNCLGQCGQGPVMIVNDTVFLRVTPRKVKDILQEYL